MLSVLTELTELNELSKLPELTELPELSDSSTHQELPQRHSGPDLGQNQHLTAVDPVDSAPAPPHGCSPAVSTVGCPYWPLPAPTYHQTDGNRARPRQTQTVQTANGDVTHPYSQTQSGVSQSTPQSRHMSDPHRQGQSVVFSTEEAELLHRPPTVIVILKFNNCATGDNSSVQQTTQTVSY